MSFERIVLALQPYKSTSNISLLLKLKSFRTPQHLFNTQMFGNFKI